MNWKGVINVLSVVILICSLAIGLSGIVSILSDDNHRISIILITYSILLIIFSSIMFYLSKGKKHELRTREGFLIVSLCWFSIIIVGAMPFYIVEKMRFIDCLFETASGFSTTGASIIDSNLILRNGEKLGGLSTISKGILFWRSMTHWLGGMGIIVLSIAILPYLGIGGKKLYEAEVSSASSSQLAPRITDTAKMLWGVYILMSITQTILLMIGGMSLFDAWCHTCGTIATGGFSTSPYSISAFDSFYIEVIIIVFMFLGCSNFVLHHNALKKGLKVYWNDEEFRSNLIVSLLCGIGLTFIIYGKNWVDAANRHIDSSNIFSAGRYAFFQV
ncbi:MAG TPA: potassium transporter TrkG, partial [Victivallales bacterium]|nr:potassium transporter TrkG [Victivallales bacterium]